MPKVSRLPKTYNRKSTKKNKPTFEHVYHNFFSALVNDRESHQKLVSKCDLYQAMSTWAQSGDNYFRCFEKKSTPQEDMEHEQTLFQQYFSDTTFGIAISSMFLGKSQRHTISKTFVKNRVFYAIDYDSLKTFLIDSDFYSAQYETIKMQPIFLSQQLSLSSSTALSNLQKDVIYCRFFSTLIVSWKLNSSTKFISGSKLLLKMTNFVLSRQKQIHAQLLPSEEAKLDIKPFQQLRDTLSPTTFGLDMRRFLIASDIAAKKYTNCGTVYVIQLEKLAQKITSTIGNAIAVSQVYFFFSLIRSPLEKALSTKKGGLFLTHRFLLGGLVVAA